jgi:Raf kinase inhibitor-like YbhB/YbcL family protein
MKPTLSLSFACGLALALGACGGDDGGAAKPVDAGGTPTVDGAPPTNAFTLTTTAFTPGGNIPDANTCNGANTSPDLTWTNPPSGTQSFAVVLTDKTATLTHWTIYNIPATAKGLPANVDHNFQSTTVAGAEQTISVMSQPPNAVTGFYGPCPPQPPVHTYVFTVYALDVATLPGLTEQSKANEGLANVVIHAIGSASFTGNYVTPPKP